MIKERIAGLLTVKSIITLILSGVFAYLSCNKLISPEQFLTVFTMVISFYFGVQYEKKNAKTEEGITEADIDNYITTLDEEYNTLTKNNEEA